jgi:hypothetical protein
VVDEALGGEYEIINFGENANVTAIVYFDIVEDFIREGDIVLWCPEPGTFTLGQPSCSGRFWDFRKSDYDFTKYINVKNYDRFFSTFASYSAGLATKKFKAYDSHSNVMSKYGDDMSNRDSKNIVHKNPYNFGYSMGGKDIITEIVKNMTDKGASVYFSFAAMKESMVNITNESDILAYEELITSVPGIVSISDYKNCIYEDKYFYDSEWHLTDEGSTIRSEHVAADLLKALGKS